MSDPEISVPGPRSEEVLDPNGRRQPSLRTNSLALLAADLVVLAFSFLTAVVTARALLPTGKGYYSSLMLLAGVLMNFFSAGLGEAAIVMSGRRQFSLQEAVAGTMAAQLVLSIAGAVACLGAGRLVLGATEGDQRSALIAAALLVALMTTYNTVVSFLMAEERFVANASLTVAQSFVTTAAVWVMVIPLRRGVAGAVLGSVLGAVAVLVVTVLLVARAGISLRPRRVAGYLRRSFGIGGAIQLSDLLVLLAARVDLLLVYRLGDPAMAGGYSVALTIGAVVASVPIALSHASFPRLARLDDEEAASLAARVFRAGMVAAAIVGVALLSLIPILLPMAFGSLYQDAVAPALILVVGGLFWSGQWLLARAAVACGAPRPLVTSFASSFALMVGLDVALIPRFGAEGAACAALISSVVGLGVAAVGCRDRGWRWHDMLPRPRDAAAIVTLVRHRGSARSVG